MDECLELSKEQKETLLQIVRPLECVDKSNTILQKSLLLFD